MALYWQFIRSLHLFTDRVSREGKAIGSNRPSVCLSVHLFPLYRLNRLTSKLQFLQEYGP